MASSVPTSPAASVQLTGPAPLALTVNPLAPAVVWADVALKLNGAAAGADPPPPQPARWEPSRQTSKK
jgi:hypothetical protein